MRSPERDLWQSVLMQAITDARLEPSCWPVPVSAYEAAAEARTYLTTPSKDLSHVCSLAGMDVDALLERMQRKIAKVPPLCSPEPPQPRQKRGQTFTYAGKSLTVTEWANTTGLSQAAIYGRIKRGWTMGDVLKVSPLSPAG